MSDKPIRQTRRHSVLLAAAAGLLAASGAANGGDPTPPAEQLRDQATKAMSEGVDLMARRQFRDALPRIQQALNLCKRLGAEEDREHLGIAHFILAGCLLELGRPEEALPHAVEGQAIIEALVQRQASRDLLSALATARGIVGRCQRELARPGEALGNYESALDLMRRVLGKGDHPQVMWTLMNVASCLAAVGRPEEAAAKAREALAMARRLYGQADHPAVATCLNALAMHLCSAERPAEALPHYQAALRMCRRLVPGRDDPTAVMYQSNLAACLDRLGRNEEALAEHQAALEIAGRLFPNGAHAIAAQVRSNLAVCLAKLERWQEAVGQYERAIAAWQRVHAGRDDPGVVASLEGLGLVLTKLGRPAEALVRHLQAVRMLQRLHGGRDHPDLANALGHLAATLVAMWRFDEALEYHEAALAMRRGPSRSADDPRAAEALANTGMCLVVLDRQREALPKLQDALAMYRRLGKAPQEPVVLRLRLMVGAVLMELDRKADALAHFRAVVAAYEALHGGRPHPDVATSRFVLASALGSSGRPAEALEPLRAAASMAHELHFPDAWVYDAQLGWLLGMQLDRPKEAADLLDKAIRQMEWAQQKAEGNELDRLALLGLPQYRAPFEWMARVQLALDQPVKALEYTERGRARFLRQLLEQAQPGDGDVLSPVEALARRRGDQSLLAAATAARLRQAQAGQAVVRLTAQVRRLGGRDDLPPDQHAQLRELGEQLHQAREASLAARGAAFALAQRYDVAGDLAPPNVQRITSLVAKDQRLLVYSTTETETLLLLVCPAAPKVRSFALPHSAHKELSKAVRDYVAGMLCGGLLSRSPDADRVPGAVLQARGVTREQVRGHNGTRHTELGHRLFRTLLPAEAWAEIRTAAVVYLVPDGPLHGLPFEALVVEPPAGGSAGKPRYWLEAGPAIVYGPSATVLLNRKAARDRQIDTGLDDVRPRCEAVLLGDPIFQRPSPGTQPSTASSSTAAAEAPTAAKPASLRGPHLGGYGGLRALPGTRAEVEGIRRTFAASGYRAWSRTGQVVVLLGEDATAPRLFREAASCRYLHLATHGLVEASRQAIYSSLALTDPPHPTAGDVGLLTLADLLDQWRGRLGLTELVVLSACDTLHGWQEPGEGVFGLPWGFMTAGAPAVIASLWQVSDASTAELMTTLYREVASAQLRGGATPKLTAFVRARQLLRGRYPEPYFWAPFVYMGDPR